METGDRGRDVKLLNRRSAALWGQVQAARAPKGLDGLVERLDREHRQLARLAAALPRTATARRYRRRCLEVLQSQDAELETLLLALAASTAELTALADRQLELSEAALAPPVQTARSWRDGPRLIEVGAVLALLGVFACSRWPWMFFVGVIVAMLVLGGRTHPCLELQFDGRSLRVIRRLFGIKYRATDVDLAHFNDVVVTDAGLVVSSPDGLVVLDTEPAGRESELLAAQVREWCVCAGRERC